ncbi:MAG: InlB B-repeat-containing protein [Bacilli bacterium]|nr:InlB B-repeat-containing protein [Bacilli bacterium]
MDNNIKKKYIKLIILIIVFIGLALGTTYAFLNLQDNSNNVTGTVGCFALSYSGTDIKHTNLSVTTNYLEGVHSTVTIAKDANCKIYNEAYIYIHIDDNITAPIETVQALKYKIMQGSTQTSEGFLNRKGDILLATVPITNTSTSYDIYLWVDSSLSNKQYDKVDFTGYIYAESDQTSTIENTETVTFNPNGGSVSPTTKQVSFRHPYESLPTPTRSGYTFKGWNGKNLINLSNRNITFTSNYYVNQIPTPKYALQANTTYTLSFDYVVNSATNNIYASVGYGSTSYQKDILSSSAYSGTGRLTLTFTTPSSFDYSPAYVAFRLVRMSSSGNANVNVSNIQLEQGSKATASEPYYITSSTLVSQVGNHTLKAVWE